MPIEPLQVLRIAGCDRVERKARLVSAPKVELRSDQVGGDVEVGGQLRIAGKIVGRPRRLAGLDPELQVDLSQLDQEVWGPALEPAR